LGIYRRPKGSLEEEGPVGMGVAWRNGDEGNGELVEVGKGELEEVKGEDMLVVNALLLLFEGKAGKPGEDPLVEPKSAKLELEAG